MLRDYLEHWLNEIAVNRVSIRTLADYKYQLQKYVYPDFGDVRLDRLQVMSMELQSQINSIANTRKVDGTRTVRTAQAVYVTLKQALSHAKRTDLVSRNPMDYVERPRAPRSEMQALTAEEAKRLLQVSRTDRLYPLLHLMVVTGLRPGEALGLVWGDVDLKEGIIHVQHSLERHGANWRLKEPKTSKSRRSVPLTPDCIAALQTHKVRQAEQRLSIGTRYTDLGFVFATDRGQPLERHNVTRSFKKIPKNAGLDLRVRLYDLRHTCATLLMSAGENPKVVAERLGHSTTNLTLNTYSHVRPEMQWGATEKLGSILSQS